MLHRVLGLFLLISTLIFSVNSQAFVIIDAPPEPREVIVAPAGYERCEVIREGWEHGYWVPEHRVCRGYRAERNRNVWVSGYHRCVRYDRHRGNCRQWEWMPSHWSRY